MTKTRWRSARCWNTKPVFFAVYRSPNVDGWRVGWIGYTEDEILQHAKEMLAKSDDRSEEALVCRVIGVVYQPDHWEQMTYTRIGPSRRADPARATDRSVQAWLRWAKVVQVRGLSLFYPPRAR